VDLPRCLQGESYVPKGAGSISLRELLLSKNQEAGEILFVLPVLFCQCLGDPPKVGGRDGNEQIERGFVDIGTLVALDIGADPAVRHPGTSDRILPKPM
jgi:hypothetical protein